LWPGISTSTKVTRKPLSDICADGIDAYFSTFLDFGPLCKFQWFSRAVGEKAWTPLAGAKAPTYILENEDLGLWIMAAATPQVTRGHER